MDNCTKNGRVCEVKVPLDGTYMNVIRFGNGKKTLLMLSGISLCGLEGMGGAIAEAYATFADIYTVYVFDRKKVLPKNYTTHKMAEDVYRAAEKLGVGTFDLYGVSHGGMMAQCIAAYHPKKVGKIVLCSTYAKPGALMKSVAESWLGYCENHDVVGLNRCFFNTVYSEKYLDTVREFLPVMEKRGTKEDCDRFSVLVRACVDFDSDEFVKNIRCPALVIGSADDRALGVEGTYALASALGAKCEIYEGYGHAVYDEAPDVKEKVLDFLTRN